MDSTIVQLGDPIKLRIQADQLNMKHSMLILGVPVSITNMADAVKRILIWAKSSKASYICVRDVHGIMRAQDDKKFLDIHLGADLVVPDGMPLVWIGRLKYGRKIGRVSGADLVDEVCKHSVPHELRHYFYGGKPGVAVEMAKYLCEKYPGLQIVGTYSPPFGPLSIEDDIKITREIAQLKPHIIWTGLSTPKQEYWMHEHVGRAGNGVFIGVGAAFDYHAKQLRRAPRWMQLSGLEWLFRLIQEPKRLWRRYLVLAPCFLWKIATTKNAVRHSS